MTDFYSFCSLDFKKNKEDWESLLKSELKITELGNKQSKISTDVGVWPTLSLGALGPVSLPTNCKWKKASQTYARLASEYENQIADDLSNGVRVFFFHKEFLTKEKWNIVSNLFSKHSDKENLEVFFLGKERFEVTSSDFKIVDETQMIIASDVNRSGGSTLQELAQLTLELIEKSEHVSLVYLGVFTDSQFFRNIAKIRATKLLANKVLQEKGISAECRIVALSSYREWTLYQRYSNMLRNDAAVASSYMAGADYVQSSGYNILFDFEGATENDHSDRSKRMARNSAHILSLESMLGVVEDPAYGSYHLEALTQHMAQQAWGEMQKYIVLDDKQRKLTLEQDCSRVREQRINLVNFRKQVLAGMNDFPDPLEKISLQDFSSERFFRVSAGFEKLRIKMSHSRNQLEVFIGIFGDYAALNARINFVKNYFQLLGLKVTEVFERHLLEQKKGIVVLCAQDDLYPQIQDIKILSEDKFIAGKFEMPGFKNLFSGQDVYSVLEEVVKRWGEK